MYQIIFLDSATMPKVLPEPNFAHQMISYPLTAPNEVYERVKDADIVVTNKVVFDRTLLSRLPKLKFIALTATGMNNIDLDACQDFGIQVKNVAGYSNRSVPEHALGMIFCLRRRFLDFHREIKNGKWQNHPQFCFFTDNILDIADSTLGIVGKGALGKAMANLAKGVGMKVVFAEHKDVSPENCREGYLPFYQVLENADVISLHCPLTIETQRLISTKELETMKTSALLINTGRGPLVDEKALADALKKGVIGGAALDVLSTEPPASDNPLLDTELPNLLITPHVAWGSESALTLLAEKVTDNLNAFAASQEN